MTADAVIRFVAAAVGRDEWGRAMLAELDQLPGPRSRRQFVVGCLRALVVSLPKVAAVSFVSGLLSVVLVLVALLRYPGLVTGPGTWLAIGFFVCVVITYVVVAAGLAARLGDSWLRATPVGAAAVIAGAWTAVGLSVSLALPDFLLLALLGLGPAVALTVGWWATKRAMSPRTGIQCVCLVSFLSGFLLFLLWAGETVVFAGRPYDAGMLRDFRSSGASDLATYAVSDSLGTAMVLLLVAPLVSLTAGLVGVAVAARRARATAMS